MAVPLLNDLEDEVDNPICRSGSASLFRQTPWAGWLCPSLTISRTRWTTPFAAADPPVSFGKLLGQANLPTRLVKPHIVNPSRHVNLRPEVIVSSAELAIY